MRKDVRQLINRLRSIPGVEVDTDSVHPRIFRDGVFVTSLPSTPSKRSWYQNALAALKRGGIDITAELPKPAESKKGGLMTSPFGYTTTTSTVGAIPVVPESQFTTPVPEEKELSTKRGFASGRPTLSEQEAFDFRAELAAYLANEYDWPTQGALGKFAKTVLAYGMTLPEGSFRYKNFNSAFVSIGDFIHEKRGMTVATYELVKGAMGTTDLPVKTKRYVKTPISANPYIDTPRRKLWSSLWASAQETMKETGAHKSARYPLGKSTLKVMAQKILNTSRREGISLHAVAGSDRAVTTYDISRRLGDFLLRATRTDGKKYHQSDWLLKEIALYDRLLKKENETRIAVMTKPVPQEAVKPTVATAPANGSFDLFISMIESRSLTKAELLEAFSLAELQSEFEAAHPRS